MQLSKYLILFIALFYCLSWQLSGVEAVTCTEDPTDTACIDCTTDPDNDECTTTTTTTTEATSTPAPSTTAATPSTTAATSTVDATTKKTPTKTGPRRKRFKIKMNYKAKRVIKVKRKSG
ncbi:uncharacterized protein Dwil_GK11743 [Drosophila willistoni]|uniref:Uncharacterized protein n=1 Tax=Drosophila willistoni TaxID=7260 RepID=B4NAM4_DROWI|nr:uncharacterized protein Dwil_GK11743 [Drosophila willistoni]